MADRIKNSQQRHTLNRFINSGNRKDVLFPQQHSSIPAALGSEFKFVGPNNVPAFNTQVVFDLPKTGYIAEIFLEFNLNAGTGNYTTYPALSFIDRVSLLAQSGNELHDYDYVTVMQTIFANMHDAPKNTILQASGGTAFASGRCVCPIPTWFSQLAHSNNDLMSNSPLPAHLLNGKMRLEVNLKALADVIDAGASGTHGINSMRLWYLHYQVDDNLRNSHFQKRGSYNAKAVDWQTNINNAVTASTATNFDISGFHGSLHTLYVMNKSTINKTTANDYYLLSDINDSRLLADGDQLYDTDSNNTQLLQGLFTDGIVVDSTLGEPLVINFGYADSNNKAKHYVGSLHLNDVNQFEIDSLNCSATGFIDVCGEFDVNYEIDSSGNIRRRR
jgi:hypothetical protein